MKKKLVSLTLASLFLATTAVVSLAGTVNCEVKSVDGSSVVLNCGDNAGKLKVGDDVKVKAKSKAAVEGC